MRVKDRAIGSVSRSTSPEFIPVISSLGANGRYRHHHEASPDYVHLPSELYPDKLEESSPLSPNHHFPKKKDTSDK